METKHKEFKPFDKVLVRDFQDNKRWSCDFYSHESGGNYCAIGKGYFDSENILPYEGNEHLVGTTDEPEEEVTLKYDEWGFATNEMVDCITPIRVQLTKFHDIAYDKIQDELGDYYNYFIRFSDFNPNDMEETKKHILYVKNGKVVKYKP